MKDACGVFIHEEQIKTNKATYLFRRSYYAMLRRFVVDEVDPETGLLLVLRVYRRRHHSATSRTQLSATPHNISNWQRRSTTRVTNTYFRKRYIQLTMTTKFQRVVPLYMLTALYRVTWLFSVVFSYCVYKTVKRHGTEVSDWPYPLPNSLSYHRKCRGCQLTPNIFIEMALTCVPRLQCAL